MIDQHATLAEKFLKKGFWLYLFSFIIAPIGYIIKIIISGELTVSEVGILYGVISLVTLVAAYNDLGMTESLKHFVPKFIEEKRYDKVKSILLYALLSQIISSIIIACFFFFGANWIAINYFDTVAATHTLKAFAFFFIGLNIFQTINQFSLSIQNTFLCKITEVIRILFVLFSVIYIYLGDLSTLQYYSYSWVIGVYIGLFFAIILFYKTYYKKYFQNIHISFDLKLIKQVFRYASLVFIGASSATILGQIDMQMVIYMLGTKDAGYYTNYLSIVSIPFVIIGPILQFLFPLFSELHSKGDYKKIRLIKKIFNKNFLAVTLAFNIFFFIFAQIIAFVLFGEKFLISGEILRYSILFLVFNFLLQVNFHIMAGIGKVKERIQIIFIIICLNFIMNIILINYIGVSGAALATGIGWFIFYLLTELFLGKKYYVQLNYKFLTKNIIFMGFLGIFSYYLIVPLFEGIGRLNSLFSLAIFSTIWFASFILINWKEFITFIQEIKILKKGAQ